MSWSLLVYPKYAIVCFFPFSKKKTTSIGEGGGDQRLNERTSTVLRHNKTKKYNQNDQLCSNYCLRLGLEGTFTIALLCTFMYHRARHARCGALRLNRGKNWEVSQGQRSRVDGIFVSECLFSLLQVGKIPKRAHSDEEWTRSSFRRPCPGGSFATLKWVTRSNRGRWRHRERVGS